MRSDSALRRGRSGTARAAFARIGSSTFASLREIDEAAVESTQACGRTSLEPQIKAQRGGDCAHQSRRPYTVFHGRAATFSLSNLQVLNAILLRAGMAASGAGCQGFGRLAIRLYTRMNRGPVKERRMDPVFTELQRAQIVRIRSMAVSPG